MENFIRVHTSSCSYPDYGNGPDSFLYGVEKWDCKVLHFPNKTTQRIEFFVRRGVPYKIMRANGMKSRIVKQGIAGVPA